MKMIVTVNVNLARMDPTVAEGLISTLSEFYFKDGSTMPVLFESVEVVEVTEEEQEETDAAITKEFICPSCNADGREPNPNCAWHGTPAYFDEIAEVKARANNA